MESAIGGELLRNMSIAFAAKFVVTLIALNDLILCAAVLCSVAFSILDLVGALYFTGQMIDCVSFCCIIVTIGLNIDYSLHIAHAFRVAEGESKSERVSVAMNQIGPAILNGGLTSILALLVLFLADSHPYQVMVKTFSLAIAFGLLHGLVFLPALLSAFGK